MSEFFYNPIRQNITMVKNDTMSFAFEIQGLGGQSPTGIYFTVKKSPEDAAPVFQHKIGNGINIIDYDETTDVLTYRLRIPPKSTQDLAVGRYFYDLEANVNKDTITLLKGTLDIEYEITRKINEDPHDEEDGDVKYYPVSSPSGKLYYTELYISQIAEAIEEKLGIDPQELNKYRTSEMPQAIRSIETGLSLDDIIFATNSVDSSSTAGSEGGFTFSKSILNSTDFPFDWTMEIKLKYAPGTWTHFASFYDGDDYLRFWLGTSQDNHFIARYGGGTGDQIDFEVTGDDVIKVTFDHTTKDFEFYLNDSYQATANWSGIFDFDNASSWTLIGNLGSKYKAEYIRIYKS